ncbi:hypothetical protein VaNZ11_012747 [Volvox africanus]|uniref:Protein kinase domain-containing protein n=1 Tax=Volvox africanus TaxID=51714 RepID=A0ABQ5SFQ1_9CHLO|nr:hypothetical protein VaNZ11_012747 [Volvox africanus]
MQLLLNCCLGPPDVIGADFNAQHLPGRALALAKEPSIRRRSAPILNLSQACATACASLPILHCDQWLQRILSVLANLEASLRCSARLVVYSSEGFPWVFAPIDWFAEESERIILTHLADAFPHQADDAVAVVRRSRDSSQDIWQTISWSSGQNIILEPTDNLALPVCQPCTQSPAALLLSWDRPPEKVAWNPEKQSNTPLSVSDLKELRRLAMFVGYGLLGDPQHARYVQRVCRHLALMPSAPSLHDLITTLLDGIHDLVLTKFGIQIQSVLAAIHGTTAPAILFVQQPNGYGIGGVPQLRLCGSEAQLQISALLNAYGSIGGPSPTRTNGATTPTKLLDPNEICGSSGAMLTGSGACVRQEPSRVRAIKTSLAHTLLLQTLKSPYAAPLLVRETVGTGDTSIRFNQRPSTNDGGGSRGPQDGGKSNISGGSSVRVISAAAIPATRLHSRTTSVVPIIVPNASSHVLEDQQPCRDVLVCTKLTGGKAGSILLMVEAGGKNAATSPEMHQLAAALQSPGRGCPGSAAAAAVALAAGEEETLACTIRSSEADRNGWGLATGCAHGAGTTAAPLAAVGVRQTPHQLALYLLSSEVLPAGVLRMIAEELQTLLPMFFGAWRVALTGPETVSEWRRLQEQLLGQPISADGAGLCGSSALDPICNSNSTAVAAVPITTVGQPAASTLGSASNSPLSPVAALNRSPISNRLFRCNILSSPVPPSPANNAISLPPAYCAGNGAPLLPVGAGLPGPRAPLGPSAVSSQGSGMARKGLLALLSVRDEAAACTPQHARSMPGLDLAAPPPAAAGASACNSMGGRSFKGSTRPANSPDVDAAVSPHAASASLLYGRGPAVLPAGPQVTLEKPGGASALDILVTSIRHGLATVGADEQEDQACQAQDLAAVQLLEVLGRGGQGVVFRGSLHGLETAVKVLTDPSGSGGCGGGPGGGGGGHDPRGEGKRAMATAERQQRDGPKEAAAAGGGSGGGRTCSDTDTWDGDSKAGEARMRQAKRGAMEVAVIGTLSHPSIVQVYATFSGVVVVRCQYHDSPHAEMRLCYPGDALLAGKDPGPLNQVICLEYCDAGTLLTAARAGAFRLPFALPSNGAAFPALVPVYKSLLEVALALRYLHARKLVHCDLKAANVLLKSSNRDPRGWTCKVSDFGCVRMLTEVDSRPGGEGAGPVGFRTAAPVGTLAHMAPECFVKNCLLTSSVDIYSFGIVMWELLMCTTPYAGMNARDIPRQVIRQHLRPKFHQLAPPDYCALAGRCWSSKPERRPTAVELVGELEHLLATAQAFTEKEAQVAAAAAAARSAAAPRITTARASNVDARRKPPNGDGGKSTPFSATPNNAANATSAAGGVDPQCRLTAASRIQATAQNLLIQPANQRKVPQVQSPQLPPQQQQNGNSPTHAQDVRTSDLDESPLRGQQVQQKFGAAADDSNSPNNTAREAESACRALTRITHSGADRGPMAEDSGGGGSISSTDRVGSSGSGRSRRGASELQRSAICLLPF